MRLLYQSLFFILLTVLFPFISKAQLTSCNVFLQGNYVEVGVNFNGAYGSGVAAPSGYHPNGSSAVYDSCGGTWTCPTGGTSIGFVADPDKDGWATGTPAYFGDMFMPGTPQEGWSIQADNYRFDAWNGYGCTKDVFNNYHNTPSYTSGGNISYSAVGSRRIGVWQGVFDSLQITQTTTVDTANVFFTVQVVIKNLGAVARNNVYYLRTIDPDNDEAELGTFITNNRIVYQLPNPANKTLVLAKGTVYPRAVVGLGSTDSNAKCFIIKSGLFPKTGMDTGSTSSSSNLDSMYGMHGGLGDTASYRYSDSSIADQGIGLVFKIGHLPPVDSAAVALKPSGAIVRTVDGDSAVIHYAYIFRIQDIDTALNHLGSGIIGDTNIHNHVGINNVNYNADIKAYPNPFRNDITISNLFISDQVRVYDIVGKLVGSMYVANADGENTFNISGLSPGMYVLEVFDKNGFAKAKIPIHKQ